jgi:hypothetical protein
VCINNIKKYSIQEFLSFTFVKVRSFKFLRSQISPLSFKLVAPPPFQLSYIYKHIDTTVNFDVKLDEFETQSDVNRNAQTIEAQLEGRIIGRRIVVQ